jgi:hypothetical protein
MWSPASCSTPTFRFHKITKEPVNNDMGRDAVVWVCDALYKIMSCEIGALSDADFKPVSEAANRQLHEYVARVAREGAADAMIQVLPLMGHVQGLGREPLGALGTFMVYCHTTMLDISLKFVRPLVKFAAKHSNFTRWDPTGAKAAMDAFHVLGLISLHAPQTPNLRAFQDELGRAGGVELAVRWLVSSDKVLGPQGWRAVIHGGHRETEIYIDKILFVLNMAAECHEENLDFWTEQSGMFDVLLRLVDEYSSASDGKRDTICVIAVELLHVLTMDHARNARLAVSKGALPTLHHAISMNPTHRNPRAKKRVEEVYESLQAICRTDSDGEMQGPAGHVATPSALIFAPCVARNNKAVGQLTIDSSKEGRVFDSQVGFGGNNTENYGGKIGRKQDVCEACGRSAAEAGATRLLKCSVCTLAPMYCSAECQHVCWKAHKAACKANRKK